MTQQQFHSVKFWNLASVAFSSGAIVMALEIAGSRIVTPIFGSTTYTWGILIGVILTGLTVGYHLGGKIADINPNFQKLCSIIFSTGLFILFIPFISQDLIGFFIRELSNSVYANFISTLILFGLPSILLGFVSPYAIKLGTKTLKKLGNISGNLYSLSTAGGILGTFLTVFALIPFFEIKYLILSLGIALMTVSLIGLKIIPKIIVGFIITLLVVSVTTQGAASLSSLNVIIEKETPYSNLRVVDENNFRTLYLNGVIHSTMNLDNPNKLVLDYTKSFHLAKLFNPDFEKVLFVGGGGFSGPKNFISTYPDTLVDVVEIDPDVIDVAEKYFALPNDPRLQIFNDDARQFLVKNDDKYDVIILDAYSRYDIPFHLMTIEYYQLLFDKLSSGGVIVSNFIGTLEGNNSDLFKSTYKTMNQVFPDLYVLPANVKNTDYRQNIMIVALKNKLDYGINEISKLKIDCQIDNELECVDILENYYKPIVPDETTILTDQFSPVDSMLGLDIDQTDFYAEIQNKKIDFLNFWTNDFIVQLGLILALFAWAPNIRKIWKSAE